MTESTAADWERARQALGPEEALPLPGHLARGLAFVLDLTVIVGMVLLIEAALGLTLLFLAAADVIPRLPNGAGPYVQPATEVYGWPIVVAIRLAADVLALGYMPWTWARDGQTPAMAFLRMRITRTGPTGELGFRVAIVRFVALVVSIVSVVGILWVLFDPKRRGWHDIVAGTVVIAE
jgi:uncharacterized RDD family membrane protein YckC